MKFCKLDYSEIIIVNNRDICHYCNIKFNCLMSAYEKYVSKTRKFK